MFKTLFQALKNTLNPCIKRWPLSYSLSLIIASLAFFPVIILFTLASDSVQMFDARNLDILSNTLLLMLFTGGGAVIIGVPLALLLTYVNIPWRRFWLILLTAPLALPSYLGAFTFYAAFGAGGEIENMLGITTPAVNGLFGSSLIMVLYTYPFVLLSTRSALSSLDASQVYAARTLGMSLLPSIWFVVLPRIRNAITGGALLAAMYALSDFGTPAIMGLNTFTSEIYVEYNAFGLSQAAMLSLQLLAVVALMLYMESKVNVSKEPPGRHLTFWPSPWQTKLLLLATLPVVIFSIFLPLAVFSLWLWREGVSSFDIQYAINSGYASLIAAVVAVIFALPLAYAATKGKAGRIMERITFIGFGIPGIVMGTALVYTGLQLPFLYQTLGLLILAYVLRFLPLAVGTIRSSTESLDGALVNAARVLGAKPKEAYRRITLPLTMRGVVAGAALVFLEVMRELPATLLLGPIGFETLSTYLWRVYEAGYFGRAAIPGLLLFFISGLGLAIMFSTERWGSVTLNERSSR
ncbi:iron ABC transporter permease [Colwellia sp. E2M01]|uniref:ABC transporter permease n=1 Tax=Colwellia sp. E2M01 TaxID=2841561 RepID=UPI001C081F99|nr:iron ABC transporter permease [Colwellia sp. E2M01]MBU2870163.1 iron ABC transporter permease [Colwellia sp. E2M01]